MDKGRPDEPTSADIFLQRASSEFGDAPGHTHKKGSYVVDHDRIYAKIGKVGGSDRVSLMQRPK